MKTATFTFHCRLISQALLSAYKGSMLRGSLGTFLKKTCCTVHRNSCDICILSRHCAFPLLFIGGSNGDSDQYATLPPPYCIEPCDTGKNVYEAGESLIFSLTLFSYAITYLPYFVHAFILAGQHGIGKTKNGVKGTYELEDILYEGYSIFHKDSQKIDIPEGRELSLPRWCQEHTGTGTLLARLQTPCRFKSNNHLASELPFRQLFNLVVRRIRTLWALDGTSVMFDNFSDMMDKADRIETIETCLFWKDWTRYSSRQKSSMQLGGLQGSVRYRGNIAPFLPFFTLAETMHIGKQTSFGLGQIHIEWIPDEEDTHCTVR